MSTRTVGRFVAAVLIACGFAVVAATPASATTYVLPFAAGSDLYIAGSTHDIGGVSSGMTCTSNGTQNSIAPDITGGVIDLDVADWTTAPRDVSYGGATLRVQIVPTADTTGTISGSNVFLNVEFKVVWWNCAGTSVICETRPITQLIGTNSYTGSNPPVTGDTMTLVTGTSTAVSTTIGCLATLRALILSYPVTLTLNLVV